MESFDEQKFQILRWSNLWLFYLKTDIIVSFLSVLFLSQGQEDFSKIIF